MKKRIKLLLLINLLIIHFSFAQKESDLSGWVTTDLLLSRSQWDYTASLELRSKENFSQIDLFSIGQYARYLFSPLLKVSAGYEIFFTNTFNRGTIVEHRLMLQNESAFRLGRLKIDNRLSFLNDFEKLKKPGWGGRDRLRLKYPIKQWEPFSYVELYCSLKDQKVRRYKNRLGVGLNYHPNTTNLIGIYFMREKYSQKTFSNHVIGISYAMTIEI